MMTGKIIFKSTLIYLMTEYDPMFFMVPIFERVKKTTGKSKGFVSLSQILETGLIGYDSQCSDNFRENSFPDKITEEKTDAEFTLRGTVCKSSLLKILLASKRLRKSLNVICEV